MNLGDTTPRNGQGTVRPLRVSAWPAFRPGGGPYTGLLYEAVAAHGVEVDEFTRLRAVTGGYDIIHVHWPDFALNQVPFRRSVVRSTTVLTALAAARTRGARIVWTIHDLESHERVYPRFSPLFWRAFTALVDGVISPSAAVLPMAYERFPALGRRPAVVIPLGQLRDTYPNTVSRVEARQRLDLPAGATVFLFFGQIRPYKGVADLVAAFRQLPDRDAVLVVAGQAQSEALRAELVAAAGTDERIRLHVGWVHNEEVQVFLNAADVVVLPFVEIFNSGTVLLALSFNRPVLVPAVPTMEEVQAVVGPIWVRTYRRPLGPAALRDTVRVATPGSAVPLDAFTWDAIGEQTEAFYRRVVANRQRAR